MKHLSLVLFALLAFAAPSSAQQPDAVYHLLRQHWTVNADGSSDYNCRKELQLFRNRAITAYADKGETFIVYNPAFESLAINESYTIRKDGTKVPTPANAFVEQLPSSCTSCGRYSGLKEMVVVHTALEYDATIVLDYTIHRRSSVLEQSVVLSRDCPVRKYEIIVDLPGDMPFTATLNGLASKQGRCKSDGHRLHYVAKNIPQNYRDSYLPLDPSALYPVLSFSTQAQLPVRFPEIEPLPEAQDLLYNLDNADTLEFLQSVADWVADNVGYNPVSLSLANYRAASAHEVWYSNCGSAAEKALLLAAILRQAGFPSAAPVAGAIECGTLDRFEVSAPELSKVLVPMGELVYELSPLHRRPIRLQGVAVDEQRELFVRDTLQWHTDVASAAYRSMRLPFKSAWNPALIAPSRKAPVALSPSLEGFEYVIALPDSSHLVGGPVSISRAITNVGRLSVNIVEQNGVVHASGELQITPSASTLKPTGRRYKQFRAMLAEWETSRTLLIKQTR